MAGRNRSIPIDVDDSGRAWEEQHASAACTAECEGMASSNGVALDIWPALAEALVVEAKLREGNERGKVHNAWATAQKRVGAQTQRDPSRCRRVRGGQQDGRLTACLVLRLAVRRLVVPEPHANLLQLTLPIRSENLPIRTENLPIRTENTGPLSNQFLVNRLLKA